MIGLPGPELDDSTRDLIARERINDFILFKRNVVDPSQLGRLTDALTRSCRAVGLGSPLIAIDQEGGTVARLGEPFFTTFPDARVLAEGPAPEAALGGYAETCARELLGVGINMNMSPVLDLCPAGQGYYMERRVLGHDPAVVARLGRLLIEKMQAGGLAACGKHFPGLGLARLDPHREISAIERRREELVQDELTPFRAAIAAGVAAIMTSHTVYPALDPERPATMSPLILDELLRRRLGFAGVIVTDDLEMGAIERQGGVPEAALAAFKAGADQLLICQDHDKIRAALARFKSALDRGEITPARLGQSLQRLALMRQTFALA
ncbi:beta-N-acetylhexosaminidase [Desulfurivibrio dismutans]|uniref:beta-N-acetylhexosaminidase n=1 Tax=Desulfurivibrio dismutans TaxID=1398908 RepID=UPI0023DB0D96|nr:beta-N-acetylhexosaminidase [Desulfurivibrio alkaliphilus]MDF1615431.1 beta-N-acetylhexosaminidase [Desulfurivibrio alkaliphilus]